MTPKARRRPLALIPPLLLLFLAIEFLDELVFGASEAAWPLIRDDLGLSYLQIGVLLSLPGIIANLVEPFLGILADTWRRRILILVGGVFFAISLLLTATSWGYLPLLISFILFYPASGAFVSISQATMIDGEPERAEQNMARWTFAGSLGVVVGPLALGLAVLLGAGWRGLYIAFALLALVLLGFAIKAPLAHRPASPVDGEQAGLPQFAAALRSLGGALRRGEVLRWLALLEFANLMLDVLLGFLALYFVDVAQVTPAQAGIAVAIWTGLGLLGDLLLIPLLERISGLAYLRLSAVLELVLYAAFLLLPGWIGKLIPLALLGFFNSGWYAILQARLYKSMPGQSGAVLAASNVSGLVSSLFPLALGWVAQRYNLQVTMWLLILGPVALLLGLPRNSGRPSTERD
jgi:FSR family fosmidomycin resistance protein-like MFS transporter